MLDFLAANIGTIAVGAVLLGIVAMIVRNMVKDRKVGNCSCGGSCPGCSGSCHCGCQTEKNKS